MSMIKKIYSIFLKWMLENEKTVIQQIVDQDQMRASSLLKTYLYALGSPGFHIQKDSSL